MATNIINKTSFRDSVRILLGDTGELMFTDDVLNGYINKHMNFQAVIANVTAYSNMYKILCICSNTGVKDITLVSGHEDPGAYVIDELGQTIFFDPDNPINAAVTPPVDGSSISISYLEVCIPTLMRELFRSLYQRSAKLTTRQSIAGLNIDTTTLADKFKELAVYWGSKCA